MQPCKQAGPAAHLCSTSDANRQRIAKRRALLDVKLDSQHTNSTIHIALAPSRGVGNKIETIILCLPGEHVTSLNPR